MTPDDIKTKDKDTHAFLEFFDDAKAYGDGLLNGKTIAIKDNMMFDGHKASAGSKILENHTAIYDATAIKKLKEAGAIIVGRTNMDEFAMGSSTENSAYGVTRNPYDFERVAGGTSGGAAAAVALGICDMALGSDTGGSIRQPAAFCGVVGLKPTYGRVSRHGLIAYVSSFDQIGPMAKTVTDAELLYNVIKGRDPMDSTTISDDTYGSQKKFSKVIGIPKKFVESEGVSEEVKENFKVAVEKFKFLGYTIKDIDLEYIKYSLPVYYIIASAEASSNLARFDGVKYGLHKDGKNSIEDYFKTRAEGFGPEVRRRIILGTYVHSSGYYDLYYGRAVAVRRLITQELSTMFERIDLLLTPTAPSPAWKVGEKSGDPLKMYLEDIFTVPANIAGLPSISIPSGFARLAEASGVARDGNLPLGIELTAGLGREDNLFAAGKEFLGE